MKAGQKGVGPAMIRYLRWGRDMAWLTVVESWQGFSRDEGFQKAGMLAYYTFMCFFPFLLALLLLAGRFLTPEGAVRLVETIVGRLMPQSQDLVLREVRGLAEQRAWSLLSFVLLFWWMTPVATALRNTMAVIFKTSPRVIRMRAIPVVTYLINKLYDMVAMVAIIVVMAVLLGTGWLLDLAQRLVGDDLPLLPALLRFGFPKVAAFLCLVVFYVLFVPRRCHAAALAVGALTAGLMLKGMNPLFALLFRFNPDYGYMFGSLKAIFIFFIWIFYAAIALLFGAEVMSSLVRWKDLTLRAHLTSLLNGRGGRSRYPHLARLGVREFAPGETLFSQGETGREMYVVVKGSVDLIRDGTRVATVGVGQCFGEVAALLGHPRTATAVVGPEGAEVVGFDPRDLSDPSLLFKLLQDMAARLVRSDSQGKETAAALGLRGVGPNQI